MVAAQTNIMVPDRAAPAAPGVHAILPEQIEAIVRAKQQSKKVSRAAGVASFSGWTCAIAGGLTMLTGIFSLPSFLLGLGLVVAAVIELRGSAALRRFDLGAPRRLGCNQIGLAVVIIAYAGWSIFVTITGPGMYDEYLGAGDMGDEIARTLEPIAQLQQAVTIGFYAVVMVGSFVAQGGLAVYYFTRRGHLARCLHSSPQWTISALRAAA